MLEPTRVGEQCGANKWGTKLNCMVVKGNQNLCPTINWKWCGGGGGVGSHVVHWGTVCVGTNVWWGKGVLGNCPKKEGGKGAL